MYKLLERVPLSNGEVTRVVEIKDFHNYNKQVEKVYFLESSIVGYNGLTEPIFMGYHTEENLDRLNKIYKDNYLYRMKQLKQIYA